MKKIIWCIIICVICICIVYLVHLYKRAKIISNFKNVYISEKEFDTFCENNNTYELEVDIENSRLSLSLERDNNNIWNGSLFHYNKRSLIMYEKLAKIINSFSNLSGTITIPYYDSQYGLRLNWENNYKIEVNNRYGDVVISANKEGLLSLANHFINLAQSSVPVGSHIHLDEHNSLEEGSSEVIIQKID